MGEYDSQMCRLCSRYLWGGGFLPARINHDTETRKISYWPSWTAVEVTWQLFFQDLSLALREVAKICPHQPQALEKEKRLKCFRRIRYLANLFSERGDCRYSQGMAYVFTTSIVLDVRHQLSRIKIRESIYRSRNSWDKSSYLTVLFISTLEASTLKHVSPCIGWATTGFTIRSLL